MAGTQSTVVSIWLPCPLQRIIQGLGKRVSKNIKHTQIFFFYGKILKNNFYVTLTLLVMVGKPINNCVHPVA